MADTPDVAAAGTAEDEANLAFLRSFDLPVRACKIALQMFENDNGGALDYLMDSAEGQELCKQCKQEGYDPDCKAASKKNGVHPPVSPAENGNAAATPEAAVSPEENGNETATPEEIDPEIQELGNHFNIEEGLLWRLHRAMPKPKDAKQTQLAKLYELLQKAPAPKALLTAKIREMERGRVKTSTKADKDVEDIGSEFKRSIQAKDPAERPLSQREESERVAGLCERVKNAVTCETKSVEIVDKELREFSTLCDSDPARLGHLLNNMNPDGELLLHLCTIASPQGWTAKAISWLLLARASPNVKTGIQESALALAVRAACNDTEWQAPTSVVQELIAARADVNATDLQGEPALMEAICMDQVDICKLLLHARADIERFPGCRQLATGHANDVPKVAELFAQLEARPRLASSRSSSKTSSKSVSDDESVQDLTGEQLRAEFLKAMKAFDLVRGQDLLRKHADDICPILNDQDAVCDQDGNGMPLLHHILQLQKGCSFISFAACIQLLVEHRADPNLKNSKGQTPVLSAVHSAARSDGDPDDLNGFSLPIHALLVARADPNIADASTRETALVEAACMGSPAICKVLLDAGADPYIETEAGLKAADFSSRDELASVFAGRSHPSTAPTPARAPAPAPAPAPAAPASAPAAPAPAPAAPASAPAAPAPAPCAAGSRSRSRSSELGQSESVEEEPKGKTKHRTEGASGELAAKLNKVNDRINAKEASDAQREQGTKTNTADPHPERPAMSLAQLMAKARSAPDAKKAVLPERTSLGSFEKHIETRELLDAVAAHSPTLVAERLSAVEDFMPGGLSDFLANARDLDGYSILHRCILAPPVQNSLEGMTATTQTLILRSASVNCANLQGETPLLFAVREGGAQKQWLQFLKVLLKHGADVNLADVSHVTPLSEAVTMRNPKLVQFLLDHGGDAFLRTGPRRRSIYEELQDRCPRIAVDLAAQCGVRDADFAEGDDRRSRPYHVPRLENRDVIIANLHAAVQVHNVSGVRQAIDAWNAEDWRLPELVHKVDDDGHSLLHLCLLSPPYALCWHSATEVLQELLSAKANINRANSLGETPLLHAAREASGDFQDRVELVRALLTARADVDQASHDGRTPLMETAAVADADLCELLLRSDADPTKVDRLGVSAAQLASSVPSLSSMFKNIADVDCSEFRRSKAGGADKQNKAQQPADRANDLRHNALCHNHGRVAKMMCKWYEEAGPASLDVIHEADEDGHTAVHMCILGPPADKSRVAQAETLNILLRARANTNQKNLIGETALLIAVRESGGPCSGSGRIINMLLRGSADVNIADSSGTTALMEAARYNDAALVDLFISCGGDSDLVDKFGRSAVNHAPSRGPARELLDIHKENGKRKNTGGVNGNAATTGTGGQSSKTALMMQAVQAHDAALLSEIIAALKADGRPFHKMVRAQDKDGHALLHVCIFAPPTKGLDRSRATETAKVLLEAKADVNVVNVLSETPLLLAVRETAGEGHESRLLLVHTLLDAGAEVDLADQQDTTPLMEAAASGDEGLCQILLDRGANMHLRGHGGLSAKELAQNPRVRQVFEEKAKSLPADKEKIPLVKVTLRHLTTKVERVISISGDATFADVKKAMVRSTRGGLWHKVAILSEDHCLLDDHEQLHGRRVLITADATSEDWLKAAQAAMPEEERWKSWSEEELMAEAERRGVYCGTESDDLLANLLNVKRWESLSSKGLREECSKRGLVVECCPDRDDMLKMLKQDVSWENMKEEALRAELKRYDLQSPPPIGAGSFETGIRKKLRQYARFTMMSLDQLRTSAALRNFDTEGKTREALLDFLKSGKILPKPAAPPPVEAKPTTTRKEMPPFMKQRSNTAAGSSNFERTSSPDDRQAGAGLNVNDLSERVKAFFERYPSFDKEIPHDIEEWLDKDIETYLYSNGFLRPPRKKKAQPRIPKRVCYETLGLGDGATLQEVKKAFRRLALQYHPDKNLQDQKDSQEKFVAIQEAYEVLTGAAPQ